MNLTAMLIEKFELNPINETTLGMTQVFFVTPKNVFLLGV